MGGLLCKRLTTTLLLLESQANLSDTIFNLGFNEIVFFVEVIAFSMDFVVDAVKLAMPPPHFQIINHFVRMSLQ